MVQIVFLKNGSGISGYPCNRINLDSYFTPCQKMNSTWNRDLNLRAEIIKFLWGINFCNNELGRHWVLTYDTERR